MNSTVCNRGSVLAVLFTVLATSAVAQQLKSTEVASGLRQPIGVRAAPGDVHRLFVLEREGKIRIVKDGILLEPPFLDITSDVSNYGEGGLIGLAFHPDFHRNGRFLLITGWVTCLLITALVLYGLPESMRSAWRVIVGQ